MDQKIQNKIQTVVGRGFAGGVVRYEECVSFSNTKLGKCCSVEGNGTWREERGVV